MWQIIGDVASQLNYWRKHVPVSLLLTPMCHSRPLCLLRSKPTTASVRGSNMGQRQLPRVLPPPQPPDPVAHWVKPLLIGHSACWPDGLRTVDDLDSNAGLEGGFQLDWTSGHAMRLNYGTGIEGPPVSSLNCDRPLHSG